MKEKNDKVKNFREMTFLAPCVNCKKLMKVKMQGNKKYYCSYNCRYTFAKLIGTKDKRKVRVITNCYICEREIYVKKSNFDRNKENLCSKKCSNILISLRTKGKKTKDNIDTFTCNNCKKQFEAIWWHFRKYCSLKCHREYIKNNLKRYKLTCLNCGTKKQVNKKNRKFCNHECFYKYRSKK